MRRLLFLLCSAFFGLTACGGQEPLRLLNVSFDPTRELYRDINQAFAADWKARTGQEIRIQQSHGGSGKQARAVNDGLPAHVVTLALALDVDAIAKTGLLPLDWRQRLPYNSAPFHSTIVFLVRQGNPKHIADWADLLKPGVSIIVANPKTSGGARCAYLAAWGWGQRHGGEAGAEAYVRGLYQRVPVLDNGARAATTTFVERGLGDVLLTWENEAYLAQQEHPEKGLRVIAPSVSLRVDLPVAVVSGVAGPDGLSATAEAYLRFLYTPQGQALGAKHHYRPNVPADAERFKAEFPRLTLLEVEQVAGSWDQAQAKHFAAGAFFDRLIEERR